MSDKPKHILWLDLETTGLDEREGQILEIAVILTDMKLNEIERYTTPIVPFTGLGYIEMDDYVRKMHTENGLIHDIQELELVTSGFLPDAEQAVIAMLDRHGAKTVATAGSGVLQFDLRWLAYHMPELRARMTYWGYDVGVLRRICRDFLGGLIAPPIEGNHRAMSDTENALEEFRWLIDKLQGAVQAGHILGPGSVIDPSPWGQPNHPMYPPSSYPPTTEFPEIQEDDEDG